MCPRNRTGGGGDEVLLRSPPEPLFPLPAPCLPPPPWSVLPLQLDSEIQWGWRGCSEGGVGYRPELITCQACLLWSSCPPFLSPAITVSHPSEAQVKLTTPPSLPIRKAGVLDEWSAEALVSSGLQGLGLWFVVVRERGVGSAS